MSLSIDYKIVFHALADHPDAFPALKKDINDFAGKALSKQLKAATMDLATLKKVCVAVHETNITHVLDSFVEKDLIGLTKKIDRHSVLLASANDSETIREHIVALALGNREPAAAAPRASKASPKAAKAAKEPVASKIGEVLGSQVHSGRAKVVRSKKTG